MTLEYRLRHRQLSIAFHLQRKLEAERMFVDFFRPCVLSFSLYRAFSPCPWYCLKGKLGNTKHIIHAKILSCSGKLKSAVSTKEIILGKGAMAPIVMRKKKSLIHRHIWKPLHNQTCSFSMHAHCPYYKNFSLIHKTKEWKYGTDENTRKCYSGQGKYKKISFGWWTNLFPFNRLKCFGAVSERAEKLQHISKFQLW